MASFDHELLGRFAGYAVIDVLGTVAIGYYVSRTARTPPLPTILAAFAIGEIAHYYYSVDTPLLTQAGITFFPAPGAAGRHPKRHGCNCHSY